MDASLWIAKTGLTAQQTRMSVISNNLANVNTTGFKKDRAVFEDLLYQNIVPAGGQIDAESETPTGLMLGTGTRVVATEKLHGQGNIITTENALDLAISGDGYFSVQQADGTIAYTRDGGFQALCRWQSGHRWWSGSPARHHCATERCQSNHWSRRHCHS